MTQKNNRERDKPARPASGVPDDARRRPEGAPDGEPAVYQPTYRPLWNNTVTILGLLIVAFAIGLMVTFWLFTVVTPAPNPYIDIFGYLILPSILIIGIVIVPFGIFVKSWRLHRRDPSQKVTFRFPRVDLTDPQQRRVGKYVLTGMFVLLPVVGVSSYHGYHYTDSSEFCGMACHRVMHPQATTYEHSAHARVSCAECHIGAGASWFVRSKLSGTRQVLAMWRDSFSRPIPPAISHLRPARETCEHCHWPKKFFGAQLREIVRFKSNEENTRLDIDMLLNTGGGDETTGREEGIHKHMALAGRIEYVATDDKLQEIPWVRYLDETGNEWIYRSDGRPSSDPRPNGQLRQLDCMDCHNRPAHNFRSPQEGVDIFLDVGKIDTTLPYIKREAVAALVRAYPDAETAKKQIANSLTEFYRTNYPEVWEARKASVNLAIDRVRDLYDLSFFPEMKVDWRTYPDNIGHKISPGCFRCHEGSHVNQAGRAISHACDVCHTFLNPLDPDSGGSSVQRGDFVHPAPFDGLHQTVRCDRCHTGGASPPTVCTACHEAQVAFRQGTLAGFEHLELSPEPMADTVDCEFCHSGDAPMTLEVIDAACMDCHEDEEQKYAGMLLSWKEEVERLLSEAETDGDARGREMLRALRQAGPLHNMDATRAIVADVRRGP
ncbi:MAG: cytochrome c3 family protein [Phycisphaerae bacterium]|jgi:hypothetical protein